MIKLLTQTLPDTLIHVAFELAENPKDTRYHVLAQSQGKANLVGSYKTRKQALHAVKLAGQGVRLTSPSPDYPPLGISPVALDIWKYVCKKYNDIIFTACDDCGEWTTAIDLFENVCVARGIKPWGGSFNVKGA